MIQESEFVAALRAAFEAQNRDTHNFRRSHRGTYANPVIARDWKWFQRGAGAQAALALYQHKDKP